MKTIQQFKTKANLIKAIKAHQLIEVYQPGPFPQTKDGTIVIVGDNDKWKLKVTIKDGFITERK